MHKRIKYILGVLLLVTSLVGCSVSEENTTDITEVTNINTEDSNSSNNIGQPQLNQEGKQEIETVVETTLVETLPYVEITLETQATKVEDVTDAEGKKVTDASGNKVTIAVPVHTYEVCKSSELIKLSKTLCDKVDTCYNLYFSGDSTKVGEVMSLKTTINYYAEQYKNKWNKNTIGDETGEAILADYYGKVTGYLDNFLILLDNLLLYSPNPDEQDIIIDKRRELISKFNQATTDLKEVTQKMTEEGIMGDFNFEDNIINADELLNHDQLMTVVEVS